MKKNLFISYAEEDKVIAKRLAWQLRFQGYEVWADFDNLYPGQNCDHWIEHVINESSVFLLCVSVNALRKINSGTGYISRELRMVIEAARQRTQKLQMICLILDVSSELSLTLPGLQKLNSIPFQDWNTGFEKLTGLIASSRQIQYSRLAILENTRWVFVNRNNGDHHYFHLKKNGVMNYMSCGFRNEYNYDRYADLVPFGKQKDPPFFIGSWQLVDDQVQLQYREFNYSARLLSDDTVTFNGTVKGGEIEGKFDNFLHFSWETVRLFITTRIKPVDVFRDCFEYINFSRQFELPFHDMLLGDAEFETKYNMPRWKV